MQAQGLTEKELEAARVFLLRHKGRYLGTLPERCSRCKSSTPSYPIKNVGRHDASKPHIAGAYNISLSRLTLAIKIAKVMEALGG